MSLQCKHARGSGKAETTLFVHRAFCIIATIYQISQFPTLLKGPFPVCPHIVTFLQGGGRVLLLLFDLSKNCPAFPPEKNPENPENDGDTHQGPLVSAAGTSHALSGLLVCLQRHSLINRHDNFQTVSHFIVHYDLPIARTIWKETESAIPVCPLPD